jgi:hypothetical protein
MPRVDVASPFEASVLGVWIVIVVYWLRRRIDATIRFAGGLGLSVAAGVVGASFRQPFHTPAICLVFAGIAALLAMTYVYICWRLDGAVERVVGFMEAWSPSA